MELKSVEEVEIDELTEEVIEEVEENAPELVFQRVRYLIAKKFAFRLAKTVEQDRIHLITTIRKWVEGMKKKKNSIKHFSGNGHYNQQGYNQCLSDIDTYLEGLLTSDDNQHEK